MLDLIHDLNIDHPFLLTLGVGAFWWPFCGWVGYRLMRYWWRTHKKTGWFND